jgi:pimeloyl-ACP methyl ester carboxylesterase
MEPFRRGEFSALPLEPARPHPWARTVAKTVALESKPFGKIEIHYREHGNGPPLLLVHGLMTSSYSWRYVLEPLGQRYRLVIPDLPGAGRSGKPDVAYSPDALSTAISELQRALGIRGCLAIGNSLGGYLCMKLALRDPGAFSRLVNVHSPGVPDARIRALHAALSIPGVARALAWWVRREPLRWAHANVHYYDESLKSLEEAHEYGDPLATVEGARAFVRYLKDAVAPHPMAELVADLAKLKAEGRGAAPARLRGRGPDGAAARGRCPPRSLARVPFRASRTFVALRARRQPRATHQRGVALPRRALRAR